MLDPTFPAPVLRAGAGITALLAFVLAVLAVGAGLASCAGEEPDDPLSAVVAGGADGAVELRGTVTGLSATGVAGPVLPLPVTLEADRRARRARAEITGSLVDGKPSSISWDGRPALALTGTGALDLDGPVAVELADHQVVWHLDGHPRMLTPGRYRAGAAVSVRGDGPAVGRDATELEVPEGANATLATWGGVVLEIAASRVELRGSGDVELEGDLEAAGRRARKARFSGGAFELDLEPVPESPGTWRILRSRFEGVLADGRAGAP